MDLKTISETMMNKRKSIKTSTILGQEVAEHVLEDVCVRASYIPGNFAKLNSNFNFNYNLI